MKKALARCAVLLAMALVGGCQEVGMYSAYTVEQMIRTPFAIAAMAFPGANQPHPAFTTIAGVVSDDQGNELDQVRLEVLHDQVDVGTIYSATVAGYFHEVIPGTIRHITVSRDGCYTREFWVDRDSLVLSYEGHHEVHEGERVPLAGARIVLRRHGAFTHLEKRLETLSMDTSGAGLVIAPALPYESWGSVQWVPDVQRAPAGFVYVSVPHSEERISTASFHRKDGLMSRKPAQIRLGVTGVGNGIQLYAPRVEDAAWYEMRTAPESGYQQEVALDDATVQRLVDVGHIWFYIRCNGRYGRGSLRDWDTGSRLGGPEGRYVIRVQLEMQPDGTRNLEDALGGE